MSSDDDRFQEGSTEVSAGELVAEEAVVEGGVLAGKYRLKRMLGQGGMGAVFAAEQIDLAVPVAIKVMHGFVAAHPEYVERFRREARAAMLLNHPNAVAVADFGQHRGTFFIVMELIDGESLEAWLRGREVPPPLAEVVPILAGVLDALEAAHRLGIVHRDLKPENILLTRDVRGGLVPKVVDFGLAHVETPKDDDNPTLTQPDTVAGTPAYMSPEQSRSLRVGPGTDLYAIGCILTHMLQLAPPFKGSAVEVVSQHLFMPPPALQRPAKAEPVPPLLERLRLELLAKHPHQRPDGAATVRARLLEAIDPEAQARLLPTRKGELPGGSRDERIPDWNALGPDQPTARETPPVTATLIAGPGSGLHDVAVATGLAAHSIRPARASSVEEAQAAHSDVLVVDVGNEIDKALSALQKRDPQIPVVVIADGLDLEAMRRLIEAGADDVLVHPVAPDVLARRLGRLLRRRVRKR